MFNGQKSVIILNIKLRGCPRLMSRLTASRTDRRQRNIMTEPKRILYAFHGRPSSNPIKIAILLEELGLDYEISSLSVRPPDITLVINC
jgi:hypothetical protein